MLILVPTFLHFKRVHTWYMLTLSEYVLLVPDSIARLAAQLVCLRAIQAPANALNQITLKHWEVFLLLLGSTLVSA